MSTKTNTAFNHLVSKVKHYRAYAESGLNDPKTGVQSLARNLSQVASILSWQVEGWMLASQKIQWAALTEKALEDAALDSIAIGTCREETTCHIEVGDALIIDEEWFDARADEIRRSIAAEGMRTIYRGVESSSNAMTILQSKAMIEAAKSALEGICGLSSYELVGEEQIADIFDGYARRGIEDEAARAKSAVRVKYSKRNAREGGVYYAMAFNHLGSSIHYLGLETTRKNEAKAKAEAWAQELKDKQAKANNRNGYIIVEAA